MTTIVAARKGNRACIAADTLAKYGDSRESADYIANHDKLVAVGDAWLGPTGPASAQLVLRSYFADVEHRRDFGSTLGIFETFTDLMGSLKEDYHLIPKEDDRDPYESLQMEVLIACPAGLFGVYPLRSVQEFSRFYAFGSGAEVALGAMYTVWDREEDPEAVVRTGLAAAAEFDDSTGAPFTVRRVELATNASAVSGSAPA